MPRGIYDRSKSKPRKAKTRPKNKLVRKAAAVKPKTLQVTLGSLVELRSLWSPNTIVTIEFPALLTIL